MPKLQLSSVRVEPLKSLYELDTKLSSCGLGELSISVFLFLLISLEVQEWLSLETGATGSSNLETGISQGWNKGSAEHHLLVRIWQI